MTKPVKRLYNKYRVSRKVNKHEREKVRGEYQMLGKVFFTADK